MTTEQKSDLRVALIVLLVTFGLGLWIGRASACDTFDECMNESRSVSKLPMVRPTLTDIYLKAVAIKLDEISDELIATYELSEKEYKRR